MSEKDMGRAMMSFLPLAALLASSKVKLWNFH